MDEYSQLNLEKGSKTFSHNTQMGYRASNVYLTYIDLEDHKYEVVKWIMNNTEGGIEEKIYQPTHFEEKDPHITLYIKKKGNWNCTVTFNTAQLSNIPINSLEVEPYTKIAAPIIDKELQPVGMV